MSDKAEKKPDAKGAAKSDAHAEKPKGGGMLSKTPVLLGGVMIIEALVLFAGFKIMGGGPKHAPAETSLTTPEAEAGGHDAHGADGGAPAKVDKSARVEIPVLEFRAPNKQGGRTFLYDVSIFVSVKAEHETKVKDTITKNGALIKDRVRTIIGQSDPEKLGAGSEPGLETLRRQVKYQLDEILGDPKIIDEVLVPRCIPMPVNY